MAKIRTLSRNFMANHPRKGQPTFFVEKFLTAIKMDYTRPEYLEWLVGMNPHINKHDIQYFWEDVCHKDQVYGYSHVFEPKYHTIRKGNHFKPGDYFSPRVWSGSPYNYKKDGSKLIKIAPDTQIKQTWSFNMDGGFISNGDSGLYKINGQLIAPETYPILAKNDGLTEDDMFHWFNPTLKLKAFEGQIICWSDEIKY